MNVLVVEDSEDLGKLVSMWLGDESVIVRASGDDLSEADFIWCDAALVDFQLPGKMNGCEILWWLRHVNPEARRIIWTAAPPPVKCSVAHRTLVKPNRLEEIQEAIHGG